jgi:hypothetical protein
MSPCAFARGGVAGLTSSRPDASNARGGVGSEIELRAAMVLRNEGNEVKREGHQGVTAS